MSEPAPSQRDPVPGYELLAVLGEGGMATVFKARERASGRICALKVLRSFEVSTKRRHVRLERFEREGKLIASLDHSNVVRGFDAGRSADVAWLALEFVDGPSLEELIEREGSPLPSAVVLALVAQLAEALIHLASRGVVHRDLKPANIVVTAGGGLKIIDFGIASVAGVRERLSEGELPIGSIDVMAPEQAEDAPDVDARADLFALGATAYRCLAGMTPFTGETVLGRLRAVVEEEPPPLRDVNDQVPRSLANLVQALLSKERHERPPAEKVRDLAAEIAIELGLRDAGWERRVLVEHLARPRARRVEPGKNGPVHVTLQGLDALVERDLAPGTGFDIGRSLTGGGVSIGRPWVSRRHCRVELGPLGLVVTDLGSANGTTVNGLRVTGSALVRQNDKLALGKTQLTVTLGGAGRGDPEFRCLLCGRELPSNAGSTDEAVTVDERHLCPRCRARVESDQQLAERRARAAIEKLGYAVKRRLPIGGPMLRFAVEKGKKPFAVHAVDLGPRAAELFAEKSRAALALDHEAILRAREITASDGAFVLVTDAITDERTSEEVVYRSGPLHPERVARAAILLARACDRARTAGVPGVAIRPSLLLVPPREGPPLRLLDAGLAPALVEAGRSRVELGRALPRYEAPEIAPGVRDAGPAAAVYAIAATAFFLLTGEPPVLERSSGRTVAEKLEGREGLPAPLARVLDRALSADPTARPKDPLTFAAALEALPSKLAGPIPGAGTVTKKIRRDALQTPTDELPIQKDPLETEDETG